MSTASDNTRVEETFIPSVTAAASITVLLYSHSLSISDEVEHIWQRTPLRMGKILYLWIRYYTIVLVIFDVVEAHYIVRQTSMSRKTCLITTCVARIGGAINLWSVQLLMQLRIFALHGNSKPIGALNMGLYLLSIVGFCLLLVNHVQHREMHPPVIIQEGYKWTESSVACSLSRSEYEWAQWLPATAYEVWLFGWAIVKSYLLRTQFGVQDRPSLMNIVLKGNMLWFVGVTGLLLINTLMCSRYNDLPWIGYGPFHAGTSILTSYAMLSMLKSIRAQSSLSHDGGPHCLPFHQQSMIEFSTTEDVELILSRPVAEPGGLCGISADRFENSPF